MTMKFENVTEVGVSLTGRVVGMSFVGSGSIGDGGELPEPSQFAYYVELDASQAVEVVGENPLILRIRGDDLMDLNETP